MGPRLNYVCARRVQEGSPVCPDSKQAVQIVAHVEFQLRVIERERERAQPLEHTHDAAAT